MNAWESPPESPSISPAEVHVWRASLRLAAPALAECRDSLSADEAERAERFHFDKHREAFIAARGQLRATLARYLKSRPSAIEFRYRSRGKPYLPTPAAVDFNVAHSGDFALIAVTAGVSVGVDIERIRPGMTEEKIAERFFSPEEVAALRSLPLAEQESAFFRCWTRKEAYLKATGDGLSFGLDKFTVSLIPGEPAALLSTPADPSEVERWTLFHLEPASRYVGALAVRGGAPVPRCWRLT